MRTVTAPCAGVNFEAFLQHIPEHLLQARCVREDDVIGGVQFHRELELPRSNFVAHDLHGVREQIVRVGFAEVQLQFAARDAGQVEEIVDEARLELDVAANHLQAFIDLGRKRRVVRPFRRPRSGWE